MSVMTPIISDDINNTNTLPRRGKNCDIARRSVSDSDMNGRNTPPGTRIDVMYRLLMCTPRKIWPLLFIKKETKNHNLETLNP